jgi:CRP-like cAMP-binding protein
MEIVGPGEMFGEASMFLERPCPVYAQALSKTQLVFFRRGLIIEALRRSPDLALAMIQGMSHRHIRLIRDVEICCLQPAAERVVSYILDNAQLLEDSGDEASLPLPAGKAVIASNLNLTPETFSRELHQLADQGLVDLVKRTIRIRDLGALREQLVRRDG